MRKLTRIKPIFVFVSFFLFLCLSGPFILGNQLDLFEAIKKGDVELAKKLIAENRGINKNDKETRMTPLMLAAVEGHQEIVEALLNAGAKINAVGNKGMRPLMYAVHAGHANIAKLIIDKGAKLNSMNNLGHTALIIATISARLDIIKFLLDAGAKVNAGNEGWTALWNAALYGKVDAAKILIERGAKINKRNGNGLAPLSIATWKGNIEIIRLLLDKGAKINVWTTKQYHRPLMYAAMKGYLDIAKLLIEKGAVIKLRSSWGYTALMYAVKNGHKEVAELLMENGADIHKKTNAKDTLLILAAQGGNLDLVKLFLEKGIEINKCNALKYTPLCAALGNGHDEIGRFLMDKGAKARKCGPNANMIEGYFAYDTGKVYMMSAERYESAGNSQKALEHYLIASKNFEEATAKLKKTANRFGKGRKRSILLSIIGAVVSVGGLAAAKSGYDTTFYDTIYKVASSDRAVAPDLDKKKKYTEWSERSNRYHLACQEKILKLKK